MSADSVVSIAWDVFKIMFVPIKHQFEYVMCSKRYADGLRKEIENLEQEADRVGRGTERATRNVEHTEKWVKKFLGSAKQASKEAKDLLGEFENMSKTCCRGTLPDPICRYRFSRKAKHTTDGIKNLILDIGGKEISTGRPAPGDVAAWREGKDVVQPTTVTHSISSASTSIKLGDDVFGSRAMIIWAVMDALANNSNSVVGVYGMGGVGKSTLLEEVKRIISKEKFDWVAKANVSENPDIKTIQGEIADALGLGDIKEKETLSGRAELLRSRLEKEEMAKKKVLIILDDLWKKLDLKSVGIPCGPDNKVKGCKLLLTSRDQLVLRREMGCDNDFLLGGLEKEEAKILFERIVGDKVYKDEFRNLVDKALHKCAGLPLLIDAMAKHFKTANLSGWRDALLQIERCTNEGPSAVINKMLQLSYDHLESQDAKSLLQLCVAYDVSKPSLENLVRYGYGLGIFRKNSSIKEARDRLTTLICTLQASSLLLDSGGAYSFKIHDLVRDFVAQFVLRDQPLLLLKDKDMLATHLSKESLQSCTAICFTYIDMKELPEELDCPNLRTFLLFTNNYSLEVPDSYFNSMKKLAILNLTGISLTRSPRSLQFLESLHTLCLQSCSLEDVAIIGKLKGLQILSLARSRIQQLPKEVGQLEELRLLDLNHCSELQKIEPGVLGNLIRLEELYMENSFDQWNIVEQTPPTNASLTELNHMNNLHTLHVSFPNPSVLPESLDVEKLTEYRIIMGERRYWWSNYRGSRTLELKSCNVLRKGCIQSILDKTDGLLLKDLNRSEQSICMLSQKGFPELKFLKVVESPSIHYILQSRSHADFEKLESLLLDNLIRLEKICHGHISSKSFGALKVVRVESCDKMEVLFPPSVVRGLPQLEEIVVVGCKLMCEIVEVDDRGKLELPKLHVLKLHDLPNIKSFSTDEVASSSRTSDQVGTPIAFFNGELVSIPSLESLTMKGLPNLEEIWSDESSLELSNLQSIEVERCQSLSKVISFKSLMNLQKLRTLIIKNCFSIQEIFYLEGLSGSRNYTALFEPTTFSLEKLVVNDCDNLRFMFFPSMLQALAQLRDLEVWGCKKMEAIIMEEERLGLEISETLAFPMLTKLCLPQLESLICFSCRKSSREAQCHDLVHSRFTALFNREVSFSRLETLEIIGLDNLRFIFFPSVVESLSQIRDLTIIKCNKMEAIIMEEEESGLETAETPASLMESEVAFHQLKNIKLGGLRELRCFSSGGYSLMFPLLEEIIVVECPNMNLFSKGLTKAPNLKRVQAASKGFSESTKLHNFWEGNLNAAIENMFEEMGTFASLKGMWLSEIPELIGKWHSELNPIKSSWQLESLIVDKCQLFVNAIPPKLMLVLDNLSTLHVSNCELLEEIFDLEGLEVMENTRVLPNLENLTLGYLSKLRKLWNKDLQGMLQFNSLTSLALYKCSNLRHAFTSSMVQCIASLKWMNIKECGQMEKVIAEDEGQGSTVENITFRGLQYINLERLPSLTSFFSGKNHMLECPILEMLTIAYCPRMRSLTSGPSLFTPQVQFPLLESMALTHMDDLSKIWTDSPQENLTFDFLKKVDAQNCKSLVNLFPYWVATSLNQVEKLRVKSCEMEEIVTGGDDIARTNTSKVLFPKLTSLVLHDMPQLKSFCPNLPTLNWPLIEELQVTHCNKLNKLCLAASMNNWAQSDDQQYLLDQEAQSSFERGFPITERVLLVEKDIRMIEDGRFPNDIFGKPKELTLACFHDENAVFPSRFFLERFQNLQSLKIFCCSFEDIFPDEELIDERKYLVLESLRELKLSKLPNLKRAWREDSLVSKILQNIKEFEIRDCPDLMALFPIVTSFQNLTNLVVKNSSRLVNLVSVSAVKNLEHLQVMTIIGCERMKEIVENDENEEGKVITFRSLQWLTLQQLPSLECFSSTTSCIFKFPSLEYINVEECPKMKIFYKGRLQTPWVYSASLFGYYWRRDTDGGDLNTVIQKLSA